jgi:hypothetical protein
MGGLGTESVDRPQDGLSGDVLEVDRRSHSRAKPSDEAAPEV